MIQCRLPLAFHLLGVCIYIALIRLMLCMQELGGIQGWSLDVCRAQTSEKCFLRPRQRSNPGTFWWPGKHSNNWTIKTHIASYGASSTYVAVWGSYIVFIKFELDECPTHQFKYGPHIASPFFKPLMGIGSLISLCLMPDDFTCQADEPCP